MKLILSYLLSSLIIISIYGQNNIIKLSKKEPIINEKTISYTFYEDFENIGTGTNNLPANFTINSINTDSQEQWQRIFYNNNNVAGQAYTGVTTERNEELITPDIILPITDPRLKFDFILSYTYMVNLNQSDLEVLISDDNGTTWDLIWKEDNQSLIENSYLFYNYEDYKWYYPIINLDNYAGQNVKIKFLFKTTSLGVQSSSCYIDNIAIVEGYNDAILSTNTIFNDNTLGFYSMLPVGEVRDFTRFTPTVYNRGAHTLTDVKFTAKLTDTLGNIIAYKDTISFYNSNLTYIIPRVIDTFYMNGFTLIDKIYEPGTYILREDISFNETDEDSLNDFYETEIRYTENTLARTHTKNTTFNFANYSDYTDTLGEVGIDFRLNYDREMIGVHIPIDINSTPNTSIKLKLYKIDSLGNYLWVAQSDIVDITSGNIPSNIYIPLTSPYLVEANNTYVITALCTYDMQGGTTLSFDAYSFPDYNYADYSEYTFNKFLTYGQLYTTPEIVNFIVEFNEPQLSANINISHPGLCENDSASIYANCNIIADSFNWTFTGGNPSTSTNGGNTISYTTPGNYDISLSVTKGAQTVTIDTSITIYANTLTSNINTSDAINGYCDGSISTNTSGGQPPYSYIWNNIIGNNPGYSYMCPGTYPVEIKGQYCSINDTAIVGLSLSQTVDTAFIYDYLYADYDTCLFSQNEIIDSVWIQNYNVINSNTVSIDWIIWYNNTTYSINNVLYPYNTLGNNLFILNIHCDNYSKALYNIGIYGVVDISQNVKINHTKNNSFKVRIYPNPTTKYLNIETYNFEIKYYEIHDLSGKLIVKENNNQFIDVSALNKGTYTITFIDKNSIRTTAKFIKQ